MSSTVAIATAAVAANQAQVRTELSAKFTKMNAESERSLVALIESSAENLKQIEKAPPPGLGTNLNVTA